MCVSSASRLLSLPDRNTVLEMERKTMRRAEDSLSSGRQWETLNAGVCGDVWGGWRPALAQQPTASSSSDLLLPSVSNSAEHTYSDTCTKNNLPVY